MTGVYYNEFDDYPAQWLENLIAAGHLPAGDVDRRSITEVQPEDVQGYDQAHFFAGIGGWPLAFRLAGWPDTRPVWSASFPCQPFSIAGKGLGEDDDRHLWPVGRDLIAKCRPPIIFGEQVASPAGREWLHGIRDEMETMAYEVAAADLCASSAGAPHIRQRLFWVANANKSKRGGLTNGQGGINYRETPGRVESDRQPEPGCADGGLANTDGGNACEGQEQRSGEHGFVTQDGGISGMGHAIKPGLERHAGHEHDRHEPGRVNAIESRPASETGPSIGMANAAGERRDTTRRPSEAVHQSGSVERPHGRGDDSDFWSDFDLIHCTDGKARRVEPGIHPLAHGIQSRVGKLRAYGNAICPPLAKEFIEVVDEILRERP